VPLVTVPNRVYPQSGHITEGRDWLGRGPLQKNCGLWYHAGLDLFTKKDIKRKIGLVGSPEKGEVVARINPKEQKGWESYAPGWLIIIKGESGKFHRLAHLDGDHLYVSPGNQVGRNQAVGYVDADHVHWSIHTTLDNPTTDPKTKQAPISGCSWANTVDPVSWVKGWDVSAEQGLLFKTRGQKIREKHPFEVKRPFRPYRTAQKSVLKWVLLAVGILAILGAAGWFLFSRQRKRLLRA
jgi:murein DD-endopeptidase MepM/ murein hydrolase activator NlpD